MAKQHNTQTTKTRKKESRTATATTGTTTTTTTLGELNSNNINTKATCPNNKNNNTNDSGFQWEGPSIFDHNHDHAPAHEGVLPPNMMDEMNTNTKENNDNDDDHDHSILAVPMLPGVSMEPIYRQHRSLSFSMGQDPTFFGYNDYSDDDETTSTPTDAKPTSTTTNNNNKAYKNSLETMAEDDEEQDEEEHAVFVGEDEFNAYRMRSKSSGAALNMLSSSQQGYLFHRYVGRGSAEHEAQEAEQAWNDITEKTAPPPATSTLGSQGHINTTTTTATTDPVQRLAEQIEAMQFQQLQQQQQQSAAPPPPPGFNNMPASYPMGMPPPPLHHHQHHPHPPPPEMYSHPHHPPPPPHYYSEHHPHETTTNDTRMYQEGKGVALHQLPAETLLYMIEFKAGRTDFFYVIPPSPNNPSSSPPPPHLGDLVIVEADRGKDLGKVAKENLTSEEILNMKKQQQHQQHQEEHGSSPSLSTHHDESQSHTSSSSSSSPSSSHESQQQEMKLSDIQIKRIYRQALPDEISILLLKNQDEQRALAVCQQKTKQRKLPMEVVDAEYQWDRRKLTFYFVAERRIDFRELVRELFKIYKTRIWMCAVNPNNTN
ncbi:PSP1 C-terminal conserved region-domain-containing protein [Phascolomyces articulosus]|uniref:PSP1 C-terminal conserved region-domain-containing protein n=1 Tax=Phascolomyces articulosus TaxID=60185 RepID=A0AAD5JUD8_9FUNG|nr:PSP1 C-terminal conserved region-domain-containing protein [Phascolomyces articulosus]